MHGLVSYSSALSDSAATGGAADGTSAAPVDLPTPAASAISSNQRHGAKAQKTPSTTRKPNARVQPVQPDQVRLWGGTAAVSPSASIQQQEAKAQMTPFTIREPIANEDPVQPDQRRI